MHPLRVRRAVIQILDESHQWRKKKKKKRGGGGGRDQAVIPHDAWFCGFGAGTCYKMISIYCIWMR